MNATELRTTGSRPTLKEYAADNTLLIPEHLNSFSDTHLFMTDRTSNIFYKSLERDLNGLEFYTNQPCLGYVVGGQESFTSFNNKEFIVRETEMIIIPKNLYLVSNFRSKNGPLKAFLFFFAREVLEEFLFNTTPDASNEHNVNGPLTLKSSASINQYMTSLRSIYKPNVRPTKLLRHKLMELLYLLHREDRTGKFRATISHVHSHGHKRNIAHLMGEHYLRDLTIHDYAELSGRSLSTFTREFRRIYNMSPKKWLIDARLSHARNLVIGSDINITEIANIIGYDNVSHFIKTFKQQFGITPKQLRQAQF